MIVNLGPDHTSVKGPMSVLGVQVCLFKISKNFNGSTINEFGRMLLGARLVLLIKVQ